jgi:hypothetical protein
MLSRKIIFLLILPIISSCGLNAQNLPEQKNISNNSIINSNIGTLKFSKVQDSKLSEYNNLLNRNLSGSNNTVTSNSSANRQSTVPSLAPESKMSAPVSDTVMRYFPCCGGGFWEEYAVVDFEEAKQSGFTGTYLEALNKVVKPIVSQLPSDVRLVNTSGSSDLDGINKVTEENKKLMPYMDYQWYFNFVSSSEKSVYSINIGEKEILVLKQKWGLKKLNFENIKIDSKDAIKIFYDAIKNKDLKSTDNQEQYLPSNAEILYDVPKESTSWYFYLENDKNNLIWSISMNINYNYPSASVNTEVSRASVEPTYWYSGGYARIDATTGKILSFSRPVRYKNNFIEPNPIPTNEPPSPTPTLEPVPLPAEEKK